MPSVLLHCNDSNINVTKFHNKTCVNSIFHEDLEQVLGVGVAALGALSFIGALFIIVTFASFKKLRAPALRLVLYLSITDLLSTFSYMTNPLPQYNHGTCELFPLCYAQSVLGQFSAMARYFWVSCIAFNLWMVTSRRISDHVAERLMRVYHGVCWGVPALSCIIILAAGMSGPAGAWCWINEEYSISRLVLLYVWLILAMVFVLVCYVLITLNVRGSAYEAVTTRLRWYVLVFLVCNVFGLVNRIQNYVDPCQPVYWIYLLHAWSNAVQGLCDALVYGFNTIVVEQYRVCLKRTANAVFTAKPRSHDLEINRSSNGLSSGHGNSSKSHGGVVTQTTRSRASTGEAYNNMLRDGEENEGSGAAYSAMADNGPIADVGYSDSDDSL